MKTRNKSRLTRVSKAIDERPVCRSAVESALDHFRATGVLPEQQRLAEAVTKRALNPNWDSEEESDPLLALIMSARGRVASHRGSASEPSFADVPERGTEPKNQIDLLERLYGEAVWGPRAVRRIARHVLRRHARRADDVTDSAFLAGYASPPFGTVGMMLLGYPELLALPPYEEQARRLFARYGELLARKGACTSAWERRFWDASHLFYRSARLPPDELLRDIVLGSVEIDALFAHRRGGDVARLMAALDAAALASSENHESAIESVLVVIHATDFEIVGRTP